jgi:phosphopantetheinyl transferase (holo-ACP synthase)
VIGNDIVDLHFFDSPAYRHVRYLDRVCTVAEAQGVRQSADPSTSLAIVWAAKEAAYKLHAKRSVHCRFVPQQFVTDIENRVGLVSNGKLIVIYAGMRTNVGISVTKRWVHAIATSPEDTALHWGVRGLEQCFRDGRQARGESEAVRFLAAELLVNSGHEDLSLEFAGKIPKVMRKTGGHAGIDISLSHHGAFAGVAVAWSLDKASPRTKSHCRFLKRSAPEGLCSTFTA